MDMGVGIKRVSGGPAVGAPPAKRVAGPALTSPAAAPAAAPAPALSMGGVYDPSRPNDYDAVVKERAAAVERRKEEERARAAEAAEARERAEWDQREAQRLEAIRSEREEVLKTSADEAFKRRLEMSKSIGSRRAEELEEQRRGEEEAAAKLKAETEPKLSFAERMLKKQGWAEGRGLGKHQHGIAAPLEVTKTAANQGVIQQATGPIPRGGGAQRKKGGTRPGNPSKVILLRNMVHPGQVDPGLRREIAQECSRYGDVRAVQIYEETAPAIPAEERVRIFVKFERIPEAMKAVVELDGRTFDRRVISSSFYDEAKFDLTDLARQQEDPDLPRECRA